MRSLTLIGMPGSGKSAVGRIIAARLGCDFVDTDRCIEKRQGVLLQALIDRVGDEAFRRIEEQAILDLKVSVPTVISTGGSVVYSEAAMRHLAAISIVVFLDAPMEAIRSHIDSEAPRGIIGMREGGLQELYLDRLPRYRRYASVTVEIGSDNPEEAATKVLTELGKAEHPFLTVR